MRDEMKFRAMEVKKMKSLDGWGYYWAEVMFGFEEKILAMKKAKTPEEMAVAGSRLCGYHDAMQTALRFDEMYDQYLKEDATPAVSGD